MGVGGAGVSSLHRRAGRRALSSVERCGAAGVAYAVHAGRAARARAHLDQPLAKGRLARHRGTLVVLQSARQHLQGQGRPGAWAHGRTLRGCGSSTGGSAGRLHVQPTCYTSSHKASLRPTSDAEAVPRLASTTRGAPGSMAPPSAE